MLKEVDEGQRDVRIYVPVESSEEAEVSLPKVLQTVVKVAAPLRRAMSEVRPDRNGHISITPRIVKESITISRSRRSEDDRPDVYLSFNGQNFDLSGELLNLQADPGDIRGDVARITIAQRLHECHRGPLEGLEVLPTGRNSAR